MSKAQTIRILPSVSLTIQGGGEVTLDDLQSFIEQARAMGVDKDKPLKTSISAPYHYDQRDSSPGSFSIVAEP